MIFTDLADRHRWEENAKRKMINAKCESKKYFALLALLPPVKRIRDNPLNQRSSASYSKRTK
jgi:hypothetical protein